MPPRNIINLIFHCDPNHRPHVHPTFSRGGLLGARLPLGSVMSGAQPLRAPRSCRGALLLRGRRPIQYLCFLPHERSGMQQVRCTFLMHPPALRSIVEIFNGRGPLKTISGTSTEQTPTRTQQGCAHYRHASQRLAAGKPEPPSRYCAQRPPRTLLLL